MTVGGALAGGFAGTLVLTTVLRTASEARLTRMDLPFLLGTIFTVERRRAKVLGYLAHFGLGLAFALIYFAIFSAIGQSGWGLGALFGLVHGIFAVTALVNIVLPSVHPRMGSPFVAAGSAPLIESPGFLVRNYGPSTAVGTVAAHIGYGTLVGGITSLSH
jgi:hypothetical protein